MFDVTVIGGGIVGGLILRELTRYRLRVCLVEKENDVCMGASKANSGIAHAGYDAQPNTLKARFNVLGNCMMPKLAAELGVKFYQNGSLVVAFEESELQTLWKLKARGEENGVSDLQILDAEQLRELETNVSSAAIAALYAPSAGIVCPYELTIAAVGNAMDNGAELYVNFEVERIAFDGDSYTLYAIDGRQVKTHLVINCAGLQAGKVATLFGDSHIDVHARKGEYILLDRESGDFIKHTLFFTPSKKGKGVLLTPIVDGNIMFGPTSEETENPSTDTTSQGLEQIINKVKQMCPNPPLYNTITSFAGIRAYSSKHDFILEESGHSKGVFHCAAIESPGLTCAPAIAPYVVDNFVTKYCALTENKEFNGTRKPSSAFKDLSAIEKNAIISHDPAFGRIICRCEQVTEGEILRAIHENPPARDVDGVKRRTRSGLGRCQGGFCQPQIVEILAREWKLSPEEITKKGGRSTLLTGVTK